MQENLLKSQNAERAKQGKKAGLIGLVLNLLLAVGKIVCGILSGVVSVVANGVDNLGDCGGNIISLVSIKMAAKPADKEHPFGHARIEYISALAVAFIILLLAFELGLSSVERIITPQQPSLSVLTFIVLGVSVAVKLFMFALNRHTAKKINSPTFAAAAYDSLTDSISTFAVLVAMIITKIWNINIDGYMGLLISLLIAYTGFKIIKSTVGDLLGKAVAPEITDGIKNRILAYEGVHGIHDLAVHNYGNRYYASVHVEVNASVPVLVSHELIDCIERDFAQNTDVDLVIHLDPVVLDDEEVNQLRGRIAEIIDVFGEGFSMHDFRVVKGVNRTNLIFDVAVPYSVDVEKDNLRQRITQKIKDINENYFAVITFDRQN